MILQCVPFFGVFRHGVGSDLGLFRNGDRQECIAIGYRYKYDRNELTGAKDTNFSVDDVEVFAV